MQSSRIETKIDDIYGFIESCKMQHFSTTKVVVPKNELYDLLDDLRRDVPDEIKRYQKMLRQRDDILEDAQRKADAILSDAQEQYKALIEEHAITQDAYFQADATLQQANADADDIVAGAKSQAEEIGNGAILYTNELLEMAEKSLSDAYAHIAQQSQALEAALQEHLDVIAQNKAELAMDAQQEPEPDYGDGATDVYGDMPYDEAPEETYGEE